MTTETMTRYLGTALLLAAAAGAGQAQQAEPAAAYRELESYYAGEAGAGRFSGVIAVGREGRPLFQKAWGMADRAKRVPNDVETKFNLGSMNKMFTAVAIAQLVAEGKLRFDDPLSKFYPDFPNAQDARKIRVEHLLTHTSGLGGYFNERYARERPQTIQGVIDVARDGARLAFEPGKGEAYSNTGFLVLGGIIEKVAGKSYYDYVRERIFEPAGMRSTSSPAFGEAVPNLALAYAPARAPGSDTTAQPLYRGTSAGGGVSTVGDMLRFSDALLKGKLLPAEYVQILTSAKPEVGSRSYGYGFGVDRDRGGFLVIGHNGGAPGVFANLDIYPEQGYATVLLMNNRGRDSRTSDYVEELRRTVAARLGVSIPRPTVVAASTPGSSVELPQTPAGRAAAALMEISRRADDTVAVRKFVTERMDAEFQARPVEAQLRLFQRMKGDLGEGRLVEVRSESDTRVDMRIETRGRSLRFVVEVEAAPPHRIADITVRAGG